MTTTLKKNSKVRYIGPYRSGIWTGRVGTIIGITVRDEKRKPKIVSVRWDHVGGKCEVSHSGAAVEDLEFVKDS